METGKWKFRDWEGIKAQLKALVIITFIVFGIGFFWEAIKGFWKGGK